MRNRAKCKVCGDILESFLRDDFVQCSCGEIAIDGGNYELKTFATNYRNFLRIDDSGKVIEVTYTGEGDEKDKENKQDVPEPITFASLQQHLKTMIEHYENLPQQALTSPVTHYDLMSLMILLQSFMKFLAPIEPEQSDP